MLITQHVYNIVICACSYKFIDLPCCLPHFNCSEEECMDSWGSKQLLDTCFEGYLDDKAALARSPVARLKDASLS